MCRMWHFYGESNRYWHYWSLGFHGCWRIQPAFCVRCKVKFHVYESQLSPSAAKICQCMSSPFFPLQYVTLFIRIAVWKNAWFYVKYCQIAANAPWFSYSGSSHYVTFAGGSPPIIPLGPVKISTPRHCSHVFLPLLRNKLTNDIKTGLREKCLIWAIVLRSATEFRRLYMLQQKGAQPGIEPGTSPSAQGSPEGIEIFPKGV